MEADFALMRKGKIMFKVSNGQDPYSAIGKYIRNHITAIEDMVAVIKINEVETNQLFMVDINEENYFIWKNDWWEGEEDVTLIDFFPVSEAQHANQSVQSADTISRRDAIEVIFNEPLCESGMKERTAIAVVLAIYEKIKSLPSAQPTLYGYDIEHLKLIANVLQKENLPPERVTDALMDIGRIVAIVSDEFEETLRKAVEQCRI